MEHTGLHIESQNKTWIFGVSLLGILVRYALPEKRHQGEFCENDMPHALQIPPPPRSAVELGVGSFRRNPNPKCIKANPLVTRRLESRDAEEDQQYSGRYYVVIIEVPPTGCGVWPEQLAYTRRIW